MIWEQDMLFSRAFHYAIFISAISDISIETQPFIDVRAENV